MLLNRCFDFFIIFLINFSKTWVKDTKIINAKDFSTSLEMTTHFHYISNKWGFPREEAVKQLKSNNYPNTKVHIDLLDYGNQTGQ